MKLGPAAVVTRPGPVAFLPKKGTQMHPTPSCPRPQSAIARPVPQRQPRHPRKPLTDGETRGCLTTGTDRWGDLFAGVAILTVSKGDETDTDTMLYCARGVADAGRIVAIDLTKFGGGKTYRVSIDPETGAWECDCPDSMCRGRRCKHVAALLDALHWAGPMPVPQVA
jgi:hypothetical protein